MGEEKARGEVTGLERTVHGPTADITLARQQKNSHLQKNPEIERKMEIEKRYL